MYCHGVGSYLAGKTEEEHYPSELKRVYEEVENVPEKEIAEVKAIPEKSLHRCIYTAM